MLIGIVVVHVGIVAATLVIVTLVVVPLIVIITLIVIRIVRAHATCRALTHMGLVVGVEGSVVIMVVVSALLVVVVMRCRVGLWRIVACYRLGRHSMIPTIVWLGRIVVWVNHGIALRRHIAWAIIAMIRLVMVLVCVMIRHGIVAVDLL